MNSEQIDTFLKLQPQLKSAYEEISLLSKKKPTDSINKFKLKFLNSMLARANEILGELYAPFPDEFKLFEEAEMPNNGDVVFILAHYLTSLEKLRCDNIKWVVRSGRWAWCWLVNGEASDRQTNPSTIK